MSKSIRNKKWYKKWMELKCEHKGIAIVAKEFERWIDSQIKAEAENAAIREAVNNTVDEGLPKTRYIAFESWGEIDDAIKKYGTSVISEYHIKYQITGTARNESEVPCIILDNAWYIPYKEMLDCYVFESNKKPVGKEVPY